MALITNIEDLIKKGKNYEEEFALDEDLIVKIRAITDSEYQECIASAYSRTNDPEVKKALMSGNLAQIDYGSLNLGEYIKSGAEIDLWIAKKAMEDFIEGELTIEILRKIRNINKLAERVRDISGITEKIKEQIAEFRPKS
ncbi:MAG TPA: hypothetical protein EYP30_07730 [Archaeoglobaceae archaeon]|nr:hypothetical protein [Archaeoglobaceae archaeon]